MAVRCPDCNKFVGLETADPEGEIEVANNEDGTATIIGDFTVDRNCADCSQLLKQGNVSIEELINLDNEDNKHEGHTFSVAGESIEATESGGGRYAKNMIGVSASGDIHCDECDVVVASFEGVEAAIAASEFEEQV